MNMISGMYMISVSRTHKGDNHESRVDMSVSDVKYSM